MNRIEVETLNLKTNGSWFKRRVWTPHGKKTIVYMALGAVAGLAYTLFLGDHAGAAGFGDIARGMLVGGFFGFFITNSPCARGRC
ncbi:hypothetical protein [Roseimarinus sediminis]|jgi:hypothetical protein|uniref:hypothetical protein n=1 Tax=Roseimarinus sediminis TaxID=1610899 RepID=UPI003D23D67B